METKQYSVILTNGNMTVEAEKFEVDSDGHLNAYRFIEETGEMLRFLQANSRHWVAWMLISKSPAAPAPQPRNSYGRTM